VDGSDGLKGLDFKRRSRQSEISLGVNVKSLHPENPDWNRRLEQADACGSCPTLGLYSGSCFWSFSELSRIDVPSVADGGVHDAFFPIGVHCVPAIGPYPEGVHFSGQSGGSEPIAVGDNETYNCL
jgi:hypothetical protein